MINLRVVLSYWHAVGWSYLVGLKKHVFDDVSCDEVVVDAYITECIKCGYSPISNTAETFQGVANELQTTEGKIEVLTGLAIDLSCGQHPEIKTIAEMDTEALKLATATK